MSNGTNAAETEELVDETPLDEEVGDDEIVPESDEDLSDADDEGKYEEEPEADEQQVEPQTPEYVQQQLNALTQQQTQTLQYMQGLAQAITQMSQQRTSQPPPSMAAPATQPGVDLDSMSSKELANYLFSQVQAQYAQPMANTARQVQGMQFRLQQYGDALALLGQKHPDFKYVNGAFSLMQRVPGTTFKDAMDAVKGLGLAEQNVSLQKKQNQQVRANEKRRRKIRGQSRRPDDRPKKKQVKNAAEAIEDLKREGFFG